MTQRDESDTERAGGIVVGHGRTEAAASSLSAARELVMGMRFDLARLRLLMENDICENVHTSCMHDG